MLKSCFIIPGESNNGPAFECLLLPEYKSNDILQYLIVAKMFNFSWLKGLKSIVTFRFYKGFSSRHLKKRAKIMSKFP